MTPFRMILRNLFHFRAASLAVVAGMAVGTAVLAGSLMVGDSVRGSLRSLAVERLGPVDYVLVSNRFFKSGGDDGLAERVAKAANVAGRFDVAPAIVASGSAVATKDDVRQPPVGDVQVIGFGPPAGGATIAGWPAVARDAVVLNAQAAGELGFSGKAAATIEFQLPSKEDAARDATIARRSREDTAATLEARSVADVVPDRGLLGLFNLQGSQRTPKNAWVNLADLQAAVKQPGRANALLVHDRKLDLASAGPDAGGEAKAAAAALDEAVRTVVTLADYGLEVEKSKATGELSVWTKGTYLDPPIVAAAQEAAKKVGTELQLVTVNLVNKVEVTDDQGKPAEGVRPLHYAIGAGVSRLGDRPIAPDEIVFNEATAKQMGVRPGQRVTLRYFRRDADGHLTDVSSAAAGMTFRVGEPIPMTGIGADPELTPRFTGVTHANNGRPIRSVGEWKLPADMAAVMGPAGRKLAEDDNREYWGDEAKGKKGYGPAPRMFIHVDAARKLWAGPYGDLTSVRVPTDKAAAFEAVLRTTIDPAALGLTFQPIKQKQLEASAGSTDFSGLFVGFSFFLIAAAALLVAMLFRLNVEQRVRQFGVLAAVGFSPARVRWMALAEGAVLAIVGGVVGVALGVLYTWAMVYGLRTWWVGAIGTTSLELHVTGKTLWMGFIFGFWVALMAVLWAVWRLGKVTPARLVAGQLSAAPRGVKKTDGRLPRLAGVALAVAGAAVLAVAMAGKIKPEVALGGGAVLLAAGLTFLAGVLRPRRHPPGSGDARSVLALGLRNANRQTARSVLSVGLIAFAAFTLITVASMQKEGAGDVGDPKGGAGGYRLVVTTGVPILADLNTPEGRKSVPFASPEGDVWKDVRFAQFRRWAGQDVSCLNLTQPTSPTILGVPPGFAKQDRFTFAKTVDGSTNGWPLLDGPIKDGDPVPVIADAETAAYILKVGVGETLEKPIVDQRGRERKLRVVGTLSHTIFQGELLMGEANFRELFPAQAGAGMLLVECPPAKQAEVSKALNAELEAFAASVGTTAARLEAYQAVQNTYLSTFKALGSLGLALGTLGLGVVLVRNVVERRGELALMAALGFTGGSRVRMVLAENVLLLVLGLGVGTACALLGVVPQLVTAKGHLAWGPLGLTMLGVLVIGLAASVLAVAASGTRARPADLRRE